MKPLRKIRSLKVPSSSALTAPRTESRAAMMPTAVYRANSKLTLTWRTRPSRMPRSSPARGIHTSSPPPPVRSRQGYPTLASRGNRTRRRSWCALLRHERAAAAALGVQVGDRDRLLASGQQAGQALDLGVDQLRPAQAGRIDAEDRPPQSGAGQQHEAIVIGEAHGQARRTAAQQGRRDGAEAAPAGDVDGIEPLTHGQRARAVSRSGSATRTDTPSGRSPSTVGKVRSATARRAVSSTNRFGRRSPSRPSARRTAASPVSIAPRTSMPPGASAKAGDAETPYSAAAAASSATAASTRLAAGPAEARALEGRDGTPPRRRGRRPRGGVT